MLAVKSLFNKEKSYFKRRRSLRNTDGKRFRSSTISGEPLGNTQTVSELLLLANRMAVTDSDPFYNWEFALVLIAPLLYPLAGIPPTQPLPNHVNFLVALG